MIPNLQTRWLSLWERLGGKEDGQTIFGELLLHYSAEHGRFYHNLTHLEHCFEEFDEVRALARAPDLLELQLWFHDVIYTIGPKEPGVDGDEELSAELLDKILEKAALFNEARITSYAAILCTKHSSDHPPATLDEKLLVDIDLAILGQSEDRFDEYEANIRKEYSWVEESQFRRGRATILGTMLARPTIYYTEFFQNKYEEQARKNLTRSIQQLLGGP